jgi:hypothetical protein
MDGTLLRIITNANLSMVGQEHRSDSMIPKASDRRHSRSSLQQYRDAFRQGSGGYGFAQ